ncbi:hypothetical protein HK101_002341, partial [Irineochytrium annulatum]
MATLAFSLVVSSYLYLVGHRRFDVANEIQLASDLALEKPEKTSAASEKGAGAGQVSAGGGEGSPTGTAPAVMAATPGMGQISPSLPSAGIGEVLAYYLALLRAYSIPGIARAMSRASNPVNPLVPELGFTDESERRRQRKKRAEGASAAVDAGVETGDYFGPNASAVSPSTGSSACSPGSEDSCSSSSPGSSPTTGVPPAMSAFGFRLTPEEQVYVIAVLAVEPCRWVDRYGYRRLSEREKEATVTVWRDLGYRMGITNIPPTYNSLSSYLDAYEHLHAQPHPTSSTLAHEGIDRLIRACLPVVLTERLMPLARELARCLVDENTRKCLRLPEPHPVARWGCHAVLILHGLVVRHLMLPRAAKAPAAVASPARNLVVRLMPIASAHSSSSSNTLAGSGKRQKPGSIGIPSGAYPLYSHPSPPYAYAYAAPSSPGNPQQFATWGPAASSRMRKQRRLTSSGEDNAGSGGERGNADSGSSPSGGGGSARIGGMVGVVPSGGGERRRSRRSLDESGFSAGGHGHASHLANRRSLDSLR